MPLVSLTLRRLRDELVPERGHGRGETGSEARATPLERADSGEHLAASARGSLVLQTALPRKHLTLDACKRFLEVGESIAKVAEQTFLESASGLDWSEGTLGDLLRQLVRFGGTERDRLRLPPAAMPHTGAAHHLTKALIRRRLLVPEDGGRIRLVHEAVLHHWPRAADWLAKERRLLTLHGIIGYRAMEWHRRGRDPEEPRGASMRDVDEGAELLGLWGAVFNPTDPSSVTPDDALVRDYVLALLGTHPEPGRVIEPSLTKSTHLHLAATLGDFDLVKAYIARSPTSVNLLRSDRRTAVFSACAAGRRDVLELLLAAGAPLDSPDEEGWTPVHLAAFFGHVECLDALRRSGARVDDPHDAAPTTALELAARQGHEEASRWLVRHGASVNAMSKSGETALHAAVRRGAAPIIRFLVESGADVDMRRGGQWTALHTAAYYDQLQAVRALLDAGASISLLARHDDWARPFNAKLDPPSGALATPLHIACDRGYLEIARLLLDHGADPDADALPRVTAGDPGDLSAGYTPSLDFHAPELT